MLLWLVFKWFDESLTDFQVYPKMALNQLLVVFSLCFAAVAAKSTQLKNAIEPPKVELTSTPWILIKSDVNLGVKLDCQIEKFDQFTELKFTVNGTVVFDSSTGMTGLCFFSF